MPFRKFRERLSSSISLDSNFSNASGDYWSYRKGSFDDRHPPVEPRVKHVRHLGWTGDPRYNRDCGGSVRFGGRTLWIWRDTEWIDQKGGKKEQPLASSTASWTDHDEDGSPTLHQEARHHASRGSVTPNAMVLHHYGDNSTEKAYFRVVHDGCRPRDGLHKDGTRRALHPTTPPLVVSSSDSGRIIAYSWVLKKHLRSDGSRATQYPSTTLYRISYVPSKDKNALPHVAVVDGSFWTENEIAYGTYGTVLKDGIVYLFAQMGDVTSVARVLVHLMERKSSYEYYVNGDWTKVKPSINDPGINVPNANAGGHGTYYFSHAWQCYVWVGGSVHPGADFWITTSPSPSGPWTRPYQFHKGIGGSQALRAQSVQAHPSLLRDGEEENGIYLTYSKCDGAPNGAVAYTTMLMWVEWDNDAASE